MEDKLKEIFQNVNEWLKFAEAKNAGIIVFNGGIILAVLGFYFNSNPGNFIVSLTILMLFNIISLILAFLSILAVLSNQTDTTKNISASDNLIFFRDIAKYNVEKYLDALTQKYSLQSKSVGIENDLANQIITNSRITQRKFELFNIAIKFSFTSIVLFLVFAIAEYIIKNHQCYY